MAKRGRTSAAALAVTATALEAVARPDAPYDLTDEQAAEWWAMVNRMPADWFPRETHGCRRNVAGILWRLSISAEAGPGISVQSRL